MPDKENSSTSELLIRLDERTASIKKEIEKLSSEIEQIREEIKSNKESDRKNYVTKEEFAPLQKGFYAVATLIIMTVIGTLVSIVVHKPTL